MHGTSGAVKIMAVVIESDGKNTLHESVQPHKPLEELTPDEIINIVKEAGIVGMGGAGFPDLRQTETGETGSIPSFSTDVNVASRS